MESPSEFIPSLAAEFPNDNPALHCGAAWVCLELGRPLRAVIRPVASSPRISVAVAGMRVQAVDSPHSVPMDLEQAEPWPDEVADNVAACFERSLRPRPPTSARAHRVQEPPAPDPTMLLRAPKSRKDAHATDAFQAFVAILANIALEQGATRAAAHIPSLLVEGRLGSAVDGVFSETLAASGIAQAHSGEWVATPQFATTARAWRNVLSGVESDLSACENTLDEWAAAILVSLRACRDVSTAKRELRRRGVAAFGMVLAA